MTLSFRQRLAIGTLLALVMAATRVNHFAPVPDASWAVFFAAGFYLRKDVKVVFPLLMALAVAVDAYVIRAAGLSFWDHYCVSIAYWFLVPAHAAMWFGGSLLQRVHTGLAWRSAGWLAVAFLMAFSACFFISNVSFFWLSDGAFAKTLAGQVDNFAIWYPRYLYTNAAWMAALALVHVVGALLVRDKTPARALAG